LFHTALATAKGPSNPKWAEKPQVQRAASEKLEAILSGGG
jgi:hypothetical protein